MEPLISLKLDPNRESSLFAHLVWELANTLARAGVRPEVTVKTVTGLAVTGPLESKVVTIREVAYHLVIDGVHDIDCRDVVQIDLH